MFVLSNCWLLATLALIIALKRINHGKSSIKNAKVKDEKAAAEAKNWSKVIKAVRSPKTGAYTFKEAIVHKDKVKDFLSANNNLYIIYNIKAVLLRDGFLYFT